MDVLFRYFLLPIMICVAGLFLLNSSKQVSSHPVLQQVSGQVSTVDFTHSGKREYIHLKLDSHPTPFVISGMRHLKLLAERFDQARQHHEVIEIGYSTTGIGDLYATEGKFHYPWQIDIKTATTLTHVISLDQSVAREKQSRNLGFWGGLIALLMGLGMLFISTRKLIRGEPFEDS